MTVEGMIINYIISQNISGIGSSVYAERPDDPETPYILVGRAGGSTRNLIKTYLINTEVNVKRDEAHGQTKLHALNIQDDLLEAMEDVAAQTPMYRCRKNSDYDATRTDTGEYRYQALWEVTM